MKSRPIILALTAAVVVASAAAVVAQTVSVVKQREFRIERQIPEAAQACIECHKDESPGLFADWAESRHANAGITCYDCHVANPEDVDINKAHNKNYDGNHPWGKSEYRVPVATVVTPKDCSRCHPDEASEYAKSRHAKNLEVIWQIDPWLNSGMNSEVERESGCYVCHGTILEIDEEGKLDPTTWPNVGVGRANLDGSLGSCSSCHTRHRFSVMEARKPEACGQCHLGPDHPQIEIFTESKHGDIYDTFGDDYNWEAAPGTWSPGVDYRAPTCSACHMSGSGNVKTTHNASERLSWELQAPITIRPEEFKALPSDSNWQAERAKMKEICLQCHSTTWVDNHYTKLDKVVEEYNEVYIKPAKAMLDELYDKGLITKDRYFDEVPELEYYTLWHYEGRRARMGAAMMAPDYAWWHGFYECKERYNAFMHEARTALEENKKFYKAPDYPNANGSREWPVRIFGEERAKKRK